MINELHKILLQVQEPNEFRLIPHNMTHPEFWIFKLENVKMKDLNSNLRPLRNEHARFDIFINGQYILEKDYVSDQLGKNFLIKFKKENFANAYDLSIDDDIKLEGDIERL
jgi:hypothetical protein